MKLSKKMPKAQTKFIVKIVLLIFTISSLLFPQYLSESQRNNLEAQLKRQAGKKTIVVEFYAPTEYSSYAYGEYLGAWSKRNGYELSYKADGVGNYKVTLYKPSKEELEQRRIAAEKRDREAKKKAEQEAIKKAEAKKIEREKIIAEDPIAAFSYAIYTSDFEMFKKYYYPYKEFVKSQGNTNVFYYYSEYDSTLRNFVRYKEYDSNNNSFDMPMRYGDSDDYCELYNIIDILWNANDKFFYDAIEFLEKDGTLLWRYVYLLDIKPLRKLYHPYYSYEVIKNNKIEIKHKDVDRLCYIIKKCTSGYYLMAEKYYYHRWFNDYVYYIPYIFSAIFNCNFENEDDALKIYNAFIYWYEKFKNWTDKNIPNYKSHLEYAFQNRKKS